MRIHEILGEAVTQLTKSAKSSIKGAVTTPAANNNAGDAYKHYRMGLAMAGAPEFPTKATNSIAGDPLISTYTDEELAMVNFAANQVNAGTVKRITTNRSEERPDTDKFSPIAKQKKNKYGV
jgi:hypothetical protein